MSLLKHLASLLKDDFSVRERDTSWLLVETSPSAKKQQVRLFKPERKLAISVPTDQVAWPFEGWLKEKLPLCDYFVFYEKQEGDTLTLYVFCIELKSQNTDGAFKQIEFGQHAAACLVNWAKQRYGAVDQSVDFRGLVFWAPKSNIGAKRGSQEFKLKYENRGSLPIARIASPHPIHVESCCGPLPDTK